MRLICAVWDAPTQKDPTGMQSAGMMAKLESSTPLAREGSHGHHEDPIRALGLLTQPHKHALDMTYLCFVGKHQFLLKETSDESIVVA